MEVIMLTKDTKEYLCKKLANLNRSNNKLNIDNINRMMETFDHSLEIVPHESVELVTTLIKNAIEDFVYGGMEKAPESVQGINKIEQYSKHIMYIVNPDKMHSNPLREWFSGRNRNIDSEWELADVYKEGLELVDPSINLKKKGEKAIRALIENPNTRIVAPEGYYLIAYVARNEESHEAIKRDEYLAYQVVLSIIMSYLLIADKYSLRIESLYAYTKIQNSMNLNDYYNQILNEKKDRIKKYVPLSWINSTKNGVGSLLLPDGIRNLKRRQIKVVASAGSGKTFFLEKIECMLAQAFFRPDNDTHLVPVYLRLIDLLRKESNSIEELFAEKTGIAIENIEEYMCNSSIVLLLDGYDEISDLNLKRNIAVKIDSLVSSNANIIITDREVNSRIPLSKGLVCYIPQKMNAKNYKSLIYTYTQNDDIRDQLLSKLENDPSFFELNYETPLKVVNMIEICDFNGAIIDDQSDLTDAYIQYIFDRESQQKKNPLTKPLQRLMAGLALDALDVDGLFSEAMILASFAKWKLGGECDTDACFALALQLGFIVRDLDESSTKYRFYNDEFFVSFLDSAEEMGMLDCLENIHDKSV